MKRNKQKTLWSFAALLLAGAALVSCSKDDAALNGDALTEGRHPLMLTVAMDGATRSTGKETWTDGDEVGVRIGTDGTVAKYLISISNSVASLTPADTDQTLYLPDSGTATVTAWYPYDDQTAVDISDQSSGYAAYDYLTATATVESSASVTTLTFQHQMAKVKYTLTNSNGAITGTLENATVTVAGYTSATFSNGALTGATAGNITPTSDNEVLLVPQDMSGQALINVIIGDNTYVYTPTSANLQAGNEYTFNLVVDGDELTTDENYEYIINADGSRSYTVYTLSGLEAWAAYTRDSHWDCDCTLMADVDMTTADAWESVSTGENNKTPYEGTFDGGGHTITGLTLSNTGTDTEDYHGLIGYLGEGGEVKNLTMADASITSTQNSTGAVVGYNNGGTVTNCHVTGTSTVSGKQRTGGVVGWNTGTVIGCSFSGTVTGTGVRTGGVVGFNSNAEVIACYSIGTVTGTTYVGGVVGYNYQSSKVIGCYSKATVSGTSGETTVCGVVGSNNSGCTVTACFYESSTSDSNATSVDGTDVTWSDSSGTTVALTVMNSALTSYGWQYKANSSYDGTDTTIAPLLLEEVTTAE